MWRSSGSRIFAVIRWLYGRLWPQRGERSASGKCNETALASSATEHAIPVSHTVPSPSLTGQSTQAPQMNVSAARANAEVSLPCEGTPAGSFDSPRLREAKVRMPAVNRPVMREAVPGNQAFSNRVIGNSSTAGPAPEDAAPARPSQLRMPAAADAAGFLGTLPPLSFSATYLHRFFIDSGAGRLSNLTAGSPTVSGGITGTPATGASNSPLSQVRTAAPARQASSNNDRTQVWKPTGAEAQRQRAEGEELEAIADLSASRPQSGFTAPLNDPIPPLELTDSDEVDGDLSTSLAETAIEPLDLNADDYADVPLCISEYPGTDPLPAASPRRNDQPREEIGAEETRQEAGAGVQFDVDFDPKAVKAELNLNPAQTIGDTNAAGGVKGRSDSGNGASHAAGSGSSPLTEKQAKELRYETTGDSDGESYGGRAAVPPASDQEGSWKPDVVPKERTEPSCISAGAHCGKGDDIGGRPQRPYDPLTGSSLPAVNRGGGRFGHGELATATADHHEDAAPNPEKKTELTKREKSGRRVRRTSDQLQAEAKAIVDFIAAAKEEGRSGAEIRAKFKSVGEGMTIKTFIQKYGGEEIRTTGERSKMRYFR